MITIEYNYDKKRPAPDEELFGGLVAGNMKYFGLNNIELYVSGGWMSTHREEFPEKFKYKELLLKVEEINKKEEEWKQKLYEEWDKIAEDLDPALKARRQKAKSIKP